MSSRESNDFTDVLKSAAADYDVTLNQSSLDQLSAYYDLLNSWNPRLHLVAPTSPAEFAKRHVLESLALVEYLQKGASIADVGSGGGFPAIPCLIARTDIVATLFEASGKKAIFLREALKATNTADRAKVVNERFENVSAPAVDYVTCRAIERFEELIPDLVAWSPSSATLLLFGGESLSRPLEKTGLVVDVRLLPNSERRFLFVARNPGT